MSIGVRCCRRFLPIVSGAGEGGSISSSRAKTDSSGRAICLGSNATIPTSSILTSISPLLILHVFMSTFIPVFWWLTDLVTTVHEMNGHSGPVSRSARSDHSPSPWSLRERLPSRRDSPSSCSIYTISKSHPNSSTRTLGVTGKRSVGRSVPTWPSLLVP